MTGSPTLGQAFRLLRGIPTSPDRAGNSVAIERADIFLCSGGRDREIFGKRPALAQREFPPERGKQSLARRVRAQAACFGVRVRVD